MGLLTTLEKKTRPPLIKMSPLKIKFNLSKFLSIEFKKKKIARNAMFTTFL